MLKTTDVGYNNAESRKGIASISGVASPKFGGPKCLTLGEQHFFVWGAASQSIK